MRSDAASATRRRSRSSSRSSSSSWLTQAPSVPGCTAPHRVRRRSRPCNRERGTVTTADPRRRPRPLRPRLGAPHPVVHPLLGRRCGRVKAADARSLVCRVGPPPAVRPARRSRRASWAASGQDTPGSPAFSRSRARSPLPRFALAAGRPRGPTNTSCRPPFRQTRDSRRRSETAGERSSNRRRSDGAACAGARAKAVVRYNRASAAARPLLAVS